MVGRAGGAGVGECTEEREQRLAAARVGRAVGGGERGVAVLPKGWEHGGSSFFNGLWVSRGFTDRFFLSYTAL